MAPYWASNSQGRTIYEISAKTAKINFHIRIPKGSGAGAMVTEGGHLWVVLTGVVDEVNNGSHRVIRTRNLHASLAALAAPRSYIGVSQPRLTSRALARNRTVVRGRPVHALTSRVVSPCS